MIGSYPSPIRWNILAGLPASFGSSALEQSTSEQVRANSMSSETQRLSSPRATVLDRGLRWRRRLCRLRLVSHLGRHLRSPLLALLLGDHLAGQGSVRRRWVLEGLSATASVPQQLPRADSTIMFRRTATLEPQRPCSSRPSTTKQRSRPRRPRQARSQPHRQRRWRRRAARWQAQRLRSVHFPRIYRKAWRLEARTLSAIGNQAPWKWPGTATNIVRM